jgi:hypothetical protein
LKEGDDSKRSGGGVVRFAWFWEDDAEGLFEGDRVVAELEEWVEESWEDGGVGSVDLFPDTELDLVRARYGNIGESFEGEGDCV